MVAKNETGFLAAWTAFILCAGMLLLCVTRIEVALGLGFFAWFVVALPYALLVSVMKVAKTSTPLKRTSAKTSVAPKEPTKADELARLKAEYAAKVYVLERTPGLSADEVRDAKTRLERDLLRAIEALLG